jgi:hypothetical protein
MGLSIGDAISATSIKEYDAFMADVAETSFLSLEHNKNIIVVYEHDGADDSYYSSYAHRSSRGPKICFLDLLLHWLWCYRW